MAVRYGDLKRAERLASKLASIVGDDERRMNSRQVVQAAAKAGNWTAAVAWFHKIKDPDATDYACVIAAAAGEGDTHAVQEWSARFESANLAVEDCRTFNWIISAAARRGDLQLAESWFDRMLQAELVPDAVTYATLMKAARIKGDTQAVERWYGELLDANFEPDEMARRILEVELTERKKEKL